MPRKRGFWGIGVFHAKKEENIGTLLRSAHSFGADFVFTIGRRYGQQPSDTTKGYRHVPVFHFRDYDDLAAHMPFAAPLVSVETNGEVPLNEFKHPESAVYILGAEDHGLPAKILNRSFQVVSIPGASLCLNVATAGSVVMYDRLVKRNWGGYAFNGAGIIGGGGDRRNLHLVTKRDEETPCGPTGDAA
jgi:tRNA G18 (ribose-2'-O)-methylase SpoU